MRTIVLLALAAALPSALWAWGEQEQQDSRPSSLTEASITVYALASTGGEAELYSIERMTVPDGISLYGWTPFEVKNGELSTGGAAAYAMKKSELSSTVKTDGLMVLQYAVSVALRGAPAAKASSVQEVLFGVRDCLGKDGAVFYQPARLAVIRAVSARGLRSGQLRLAGISFSAGRFTAKVEFR